jgi:ABC-type bacteriocin/lantibiotic exporter with double-glycine peptidase domain
MILNFGFIALGATAACINLGAPFFLGYAIDYYQKNHGLHLGYILFACGGLILSPCMRLGSKFYLARSNASTRLKLKQKTVNILIQHDKCSPSEGDIIEFVDNDIDNSIYLRHSIYYDASISIAAILISLLAIYNYHPILTLAPVAAIIFALLVFKFTRTITKNAYGQYVEMNTSLISKMLSAAKTKTRPPLITFTTLKNTALQTLWKTQLKISTLEAISGLSFLIGTSVLLYLGSYLLRTDALTIGAFIAAAMYIERILVPLNFLLGIYFSSAEALYRQSRVRSLHEREQPYD